MKITRRQLRRLIKESMIRSIEEGLPMIPPEEVEEIKSLIATKNKENEAMAARSIEQFYNNLYQIEIDKGDIISVGVRNPKEFVLMGEDTDLIDFMRSFDLKIDNEMPPRSGSEESPMIPEATLEDPNHTRVYFDFPEDPDEDLEVGFDKEPSGFANSRFILDPNRDDEGDYY
jgi:hypothetical protein